VELYPPTGPFLINTIIFGIPIVVRWYGVLIVCGALFGGWIAARRAAARGIDPDHVWNQLMLGMVLGIIGARAYYVFFEWPRFAGRSWLEIINPATGGLAIHGALIGAVLSAWIYTWRNQLPFRQWLDICLFTFLPAQAIGRWGNFFNQEAYGVPTTLGFGVRIDQVHRVIPYDDMQRYPPDTLFHATFLYESFWNLVGFGTILLIEQRFKKWLRPLDIAMFYLIWTGLGRLWIEGLRTDSLCTSFIGGECVGAWRTAQLVSFGLIFVGLLGLLLNRWFTNRRKLRSQAA
jgi:phosphatidylglycerol:prolipoprotein diacylglycerol transferase